MRDPNPREQKSASVTLSVSPSLRVLISDCPVYIFHACAVSMLHLPDPCWTGYLPVTVSPLCGAHRMCVSSRNAWSQSIGSSLAFQLPDEAAKGQGKETEGREAAQTPCNPGTGKCQ